ncbi:hypothetical protein NLI96_g12263 [Meripilus lineatus]|uniref:Uncharacterized protein n=1 Tax=Meripilus lineatus TaxID=2056292 RepID=A0AAD5UUX9_9APHY|nr:hypothetical protein NLI96_g12263 [Physisporinus lineatus]
MAIRFSKDSGLLLDEIFSVDRWNVDRYLASLPDASPEQQQIGIRNMQRYLWNLPPSVTSHSAGVLRICKGMPVMLKHNEATEVCATNGAEGTIVDCHTREGLYARKAIDTIFVKLVNPPKNVQIGNLPLNVVPVVPSSKTVSCPLGPARSFLNVRREQVELLPNFAMSDYCSQGRTRPYNVVDLSTCRLHQSIYTCLSRASSLEGTVIIREFSDRLLTCRASSDLRKEFRELEILDYLTDLEYKNRLPANAPRSDRLAAISYYVKAVGGLYMPPKAHQALIDKNLRPRKHAAELPDLLPGEHPLDRIHEPPRQPVIFVLKWDSLNWSCAYDSVIFLVWSMIQFDHLTVTQINERSYLPEGKTLFSELLQLKQSSSHSSESLQIIREYWRTLLSTHYPQTFPRFGHRGAAVSALLEKTFRHQQAFGSLKKTCVVCNTVDTIHSFHNSLWPVTADILLRVARQGVVHSKDIIAALLGNENIGDCTVCGTHDSVWNYTQFTTPPELIMIEFIPADLTAFVFIIDQFYNHMSLGTYTLQGIIYLGSYHFTARMLQEDYEIWRHDGTQQGGAAFAESRFDALTTDLSDMDGRKVNFLIYRRMHPPNGLLAV